RTMECRAFGMCLDSQSRGYLGKDRKMSSAAGGNLSRMHKTQETAKESRLNFMYSHLRNRTLAFTKTCGSVTCARNWRFVLNAQTGKTALHTTRSRSARCAANSWRESLLRNVPEGRCDRSLARSAWDSATPKSRPVGYGVIRAGVRTDSMIGVMKFRMRELKTFMLYGFWPTIQFFPWQTLSRA